MSVWAGIVYGLAGTVMAVALGSLFFEDGSPLRLRAPHDLVGLVACLLVNVAGWVYAVVTVDS